MSGDEERVSILAVRGQQALAAGALDAAVADFGTAIALAREMVAGQPGDSRLLGLLGSLLYSLGAALNGKQDYDESVRVLTEAEDLYRKAAVPQTPELVADVRLRRAEALAALGAGVSAVIDAQAAVLTYIRRASPDRVDGAYLGLARALMLASDVFGAFADPAIALEAARQGLSWLVSAVNAGRPDLLDAAMQPAMTRAASVELALLAALGRTEEQASAASLLQWQGAAPVPTRTQDRLAGGGLSAASGGVDDAVTALRSVAGDDYGLVDLLLRSPVGPLCAPVLRVVPQDIVRAAARAGGGASLLLQRGQHQAGIRLGIEAHFLLAFALENSDSWPADMDAALVLWCSVLARIASQLDADGDRPLARDVAEWGTKMFLTISPDYAEPEAAAALARATATFDRLTR